MTHDNLASIFRNQEQLVETMSRLAEHQGSGNGGGGMEHRIGRLETAMDKIDDRLRGVEIGVATLAERVAHLPSKGFIVSVVLIALAVIAAMIGFSDSLKTLFGRGA